MRCPSLTLRVPISTGTPKWANTTFGPGGLCLLSEGETPEAALKTLLDGDSQREHHQIGIIDSFNDRYRDLRVDDHPESIEELRRIYNLHTRVYPSP